MTDHDKLVSALLDGKRIPAGVYVLDRPMDLSFLKTAPVTAPRAPVPVEPAPMAVIEPAPAPAALDDVWEDVPKGEHDSD